MDPESEKTQAFEVSKSLLDFFYKQAPLDQGKQRPTVLYDLILMEIIDRTELRSQEAIRERLSHLFDAETQALLKWCA